MENQVSIIEAIFLGIVQGVTEFVPVSSSGHLIIANELFNIESSLVFDVALHGGTLLALAVFFYKDILRLVKALVIKSEETRLAWLLAAATIPAVIVGVLLESSVESTFRSTNLVAINLIVAGLLMFVAEHYSKKLEKTKKLEQISVKQALGVGAAQALAIIPGVSRSGSTITMGLLVGLDRVRATRFAFLLGMPIIAGAFFKTIIGEGMGDVQANPVIFLAGGLTAFVSGLFAIKFLLRYLSSHSLSAFAWYRVGLGLLVLLLMR